MDNFCLHESNKKLFYGSLKQLLATHQKLSISIKPYKPKRSLSQNALSHVWYKQISDYLIAKGRDWCSESWVKNSLKATYLGFEEVEYTDFITGEVITKQELRHTSELDKGDMHYYMNQVEAWCAQFGLILKTPEDSEYMKLKRRQEQ
ncbi:recombination protein NinB [Xenorhabdus bovienii]|uniref:recombination protein NinB n=1 Tax=Xenorhabdus bovienii TaxID=40576 RepID=UPI0023B22473|nr:recombination protein NinB [Xenorhabdus bovienii]MDE9443904.1 recombination protein NinB [Xenorhabdus bovienii]